MKALHVVVTGKVQGVWFRAWTKEQAAALGVTGWVRNRRDGSVEAVVAGEAAALARMLELLRDGPPLAKVDSLQSEPWEGEIPRSFEQRRTA
jgi:acylphosphatase